jgi:hypothetical protein
MVTIIGRQSSSEAVGDGDGEDVAGVGSVAGFMAALAAEASMAVLAAGTVADIGKPYSVCLVSLHGTAQELCGSVTLVFAVAFVSVENDQLRAISETFECRSLRTVHIASGSSTGSPSTRAFQQKL